MLRSLIYCLYILLEGCDSRTRLENSLSRGDEKSSYLDFSSPPLLVYGKNGIGSVLNTALGPLYLRNGKREISSFDKMPVARSEKRSSKEQLLLSFPPDETIQKERALQSFYESQPVNTAQVPRLLAMDQSRVDDYHSPRTIMTTTLSRVLTSKKNAKQLGAMLPEGDEYSRILEWSARNSRETKGNPSASQILQTLHRLGFWAEENQISKLSEKDPPQWFLVKDVVGPGILTSRAAVPWLRVRSPTSDIVAEILGKKSGADQYMSGSGNNYLLLNSQDLFDHIRQQQSNFNPSATYSILNPAGFFDSHLQYQDVFLSPVASTRPGKALLMPNPNLIKLLSNGKKLSATKSEETSGQPKSKLPEPTLQLPHPDPGVTVKVDANAKLNQEPVPHSLVPTPEEREKSNEIQQALKENRRITLNQVQTESAGDRDKILALAKQEMLGENGTVSEFTIQGQMDQNSIFPFAGLDSDRLSFQNDMKKSIEIQPPVTIPGSLFSGSVNNNQLPSTLERRTTNNGYFSDSLKKNSFKQIGPFQAPLRLQRRLSESPSFLRLIPMKINSAPLLMLPSLRRSKLSADDLTVGKTIGFESSPELYENNPNLFNIIHKFKPIHEENLQNQELFNEERGKLSLDSIPNANLLTLHVPFNKMNGLFQGQYKEQALGDKSIASLGAKSNLNANKILLSPFSAVPNGLKSMEKNTGQENYMKNNNPLNDILFHIPRPASNVANNVASSTENRVIVISNAKNTADEESADINKNKIEHVGQISNSNKQDQSDKKLEEESPRAQYLSRLTKDKPEKPSEPDGVKSDLTKVSNGNGCCDDDCDNSGVVSNTQRPPDVKTEISQKEPHAFNITHSFVIFTRIEGLTDIDKKGERFIQDSSLLNKKLSGSKILKRMVIGTQLGSKEINFTLPVAAVDDSPKSTFPKVSLNEDSLLKIPINLDLTSLKSIPLHIDINGVDHLPLDLDTRSMKELPLYIDLDKVRASKRSIRDTRSRNRLKIGTISINPVSNHA